MAEVRPDAAPSNPELGELADAPTDTELITRVRAGDSAAYEELFLRHRDVALRYARRITDRERAEDLCAEAFTKILDLLQRGKGPDVAFRAYLLTTVRTNYLNTLRKGNREDLVADHEASGRFQPVLDDPDNRFDQQAIFRAFAHLPQRWQVVLWMTSVEGLNHDEVGAKLDIKPNAVASLAFRARAGLRQAYLAEHVLDAADPVCQTIVELLPNYLQGRMSPRRRANIERHLEGCVGCSAAALELTEMESRLGALLAPLALLGIGGWSATSTAVVAAPGWSLGSLLAGAASHVKSATTSAPVAVGTKAAAFAAVAALGTVVGTEALTAHESAQTRSVALGVAAALQAPQVTAQARPPVNRRTARPVRPAPLTPPASAAPLEPVHSAAPTPEGRPSTRPTSMAPAPPGFLPTPPAAPTAPPTPPSSPTPTTSPTADVPVLRFGTATIDDSASGHGRVQVTLSVEGATRGTRLSITTDRTRWVRIQAAGTGWECAPTEWTWQGSDVMLAETRTACTFVADGHGSPLELTYGVASGAQLHAGLTAADGTDVPDDVRLALRD